MRQPPAARAALGLDRWPPYPDAVGRRRGGTRWWPGLWPAWLGQLRAALADRAAGALSGGDGGGGGGGGATVGGLFGAAEQAYYHTSATSTSWPTASRAGSTAPRSGPGLGIGPAST
jgi:hypothetical protein